MSAQLMPDARDPHAAGKKVPLGINSHERLDAPDGRASRVLIYLDNNATTAVRPEVRAAMEPYLAEAYANPSSLHRFGADAGRALDDARERVAGFLSARHPSEIVFTSCGTEANVTAIRGILAAHPTKRHIVSTQVEHPSVLLLLEQLEQEGYRVTYLPVAQEGSLQAERVRDAVSDETALVTIMAANNETGVRFPFDEIGAIARERGIIFHVDAVQLVPHLPLSLGSTPIDLLTFSGHKLHAPKGIAALYVRKGLKLRPLLVGHQERGLRGGTENVAGAVGLAQACELARASYTDDARVRSLRDRLEEGLVSSIPGVTVNGARTSRISNTLSVLIDGIEGETLVLTASEKGIAVSTGSACTAGSVEPSHVLLAMGIPYEKALGALRFSLSVLTTDAEIDAALAEIPGLVAMLRSVKSQARAYA